MAGLPDVKLPDDITPGAIKQFLDDPTLLTQMMADATGQMATATDAAATSAADAATAAKKSAEDQVAAAIQMATTTKQRIEFALKALLSGNLTDPTALEEI